MLWVDLFWNVMGHSCFRVTYGLLDKLCCTEGRREDVGKESDSGIGQSWV